MNGRKMIGAAAMVAAIGGGALVGAVSGAPGVSGAQEDTTTTAPETTPDAPPAGEHGPHRGGPGLFGMKVGAAAEAIGISEDDLKAAIEDGQTLAEIAEANGVDRQTVVDALVAAGEAQLDELRATLPERMDEVMDREIGERDEGLRGRLRERLGG
jgi:hypothetical protein